MSSAPSEPTPPTTCRCASLYGSSEIAAASNGDESRPSHRKPYLSHWLPSCIVDRPSGMSKDLTGLKDSVKEIQKKLNGHTGLASSAEGATNGFCQALSNVFEFALTQGRDHQAWDIVESKYESWAKTMAMSITALHRCQDPKLKKLGKDLATSFRNVVSLHQDCQERIRISSRTVSQRATQALSRWVSLIGGLLSQSTDGSQDIEMGSTVSLDGLFRTVASQFASDNPPISVEKEGFRVPSGPAQLCHEVDKERWNQIQKEVLDIDTALYIRKNPIGRASQRS